MIINNIIFGKLYKFLHFIDYVIRAIYGAAVLTDYLEIAGQQTHRMN
jgi:hypothetical protein